VPANWVGGSSCEGEVIAALKKDVSCEKIF